jgi:hypothetical protein
MENAIHHRIHPTRRWTYIKSSTASLNLRFVPKDNDLVAHIFHATEEAAEAVQQYQNVPLQFLEGVKIEFLLARMAWTLFSYWKIFCLQGGAGRSQGLVAIGSGWKKRWTGTNPTKSTCILGQEVLVPRKRLTGHANQEAPRNGEAQHDDEAADDDEGEWRQRGRKMRRPSYVSYTSSSASRCVYRSDSEVSEFGDAALLASLRTVHDCQFNAWQIVNEIRRSSYRLCKIQTPDRLTRQPIMSNQSP